MTSTDQRPRTSTVPGTRAAVVAMAVAVVLVVAAMVVPSVVGEDVRVHFPPLHAWWGPRFKAPLLIAVAIALALVWWLPRAARTLRWGALLAVTYASSLAWSVSLAMMDGRYGISRVFERRGEYLYDAVRVDDVGQMLREFISRIPYTADDNWHTHVAGHPPGALLWFVGLDRIGIDDPFWVGIATAVVAATAFVAVLLTLRLLSDEDVARRAVPWLVLAPMVVWWTVDGDALFAAVAAWGLFLLALAARRRSAAIGLGAGVVLGVCVFLSYGLVLLGILALAVLWLGRSWRPLLPAVVGALLVVAAFAVAGFAWWEAYPVLQQRYHDGIASERAYGYWVWANLAAWTFTVGLVTWAAFPRAWHAIRSRGRAAAMPVLAAAAILTILVASLSGMSKAETERIFMPFTLWTLALPSLLPERWQRPALLSQVLVAVLCQALIITRW